ncbi:hypothetical protein B6A42_02290 [Vibrio coralliilyticus]|nr:hypothetical protein B6A42_02290 [Vibrio coralliilyticus]
MVRAKDVRGKTGMSTKHFDPNKSFFELPIVIGTLVAFSLAATTLIVVIILKSDLLGQFDLSYVGFNNLFKYFKFPLAILALLIPIGAIFAANHRSEQTKHQIKITESQNLFNGYYKHLEEFEKYADKNIEHIESYFELAGYCKRLNTRYLHDLLFPEMLSHGNLQVNNTFLLQLDYICFSVANGLSTTNASMRELRRSAKDAHNKLVSFITINNLNFGPLLNHDFQSHQKDMEKYIEGFSSDTKRLETAEAYAIVDILYRMHFILEVIITCAKFDTTYTESKALTAFSESIEEVVMNENSKAQPYLLAWKRLIVVQEFNDDSSLATTGRVHPITKDKFLNYTQNRLKTIRKHAVQSELKAFIEDNLKTKDT